MAGRLEGKTAIVTGAGTGLGAAIACRFAAEGARVAISGRRREPLEETACTIRTAGGTVLSVPGDSATSEGVERLFAATQEAFGPVEVLVNNAAIAGPTAPAWEIDPADWEETLRINITGPWLCARAAARQMMPEHRGRIINIGSVSGKRPLANRTPYTATKMALVGLTRTLAVELGPSNITVNNISPWAVKTPRLDDLAARAGIPVEKLIENAAAGSALKRLGEPSDTAALALFLASDEARSITGMDITVDGGVWFS